MGWAHGERNGREIGYGVEAKCDHPECNEIIDRGVSYACGGLPDKGCGGFYCSMHIHDHQHFEYGGECEVVTAWNAEDDEPATGSGEVAP